jgi:thiamine-phosphate pyrophosphorylase
MREGDLCGFYVVITESFCNGRTSLEVLDAVLSAGVRLVQLREKNKSDGEVYSLARAYRERTRAQDALLIINDRVDLALAVEADGVHLGQEDLPVDVAQRLAPDLLIGVSTHNLDEALAAEESGADYVNIGPIFDTQTKSVATGSVGPEMLGAIVPRLSIPFTCMGGINAQNIHRVVNCGARHVAVVTAVTAQPDVGRAATELREAIGSLS